MPVPSPDELIRTYPAHTPEQVAVALGLEVMRVETLALLPGVVVYSEFQPGNTILLYHGALTNLARQRGEPLARIEQWHIAHELYHALAERHGQSPWRVREIDADLWADELTTLCPVP